MTYNKPVVSLTTKGGFPFSFGIEKAKAIIANIDKIKAFVNENKATPSATYARLDGKTIGKTTT